MFWGITDGNLLENCWVSEGIWSGMMTNFAGFVLGKDPFGVFWFLENLWMVLQENVINITFQSIQLK